MTDKLTERLAKLRRVTVAAGATPGEAESAARMAAALEKKIGGPGVQKPHVAPPLTEAPFARRHEESRVWLNSKTDYPHWAKPVMLFVTPAMVTVIDEYGDHVSAVIKFAQRTYAFKTEEARDAFDRDMEKYRFREK